MPPILPRKRLRSDSPKPEPPPKKARNTHPRRSKESVFNALDTPPTVLRTLSQTKKFLEEGDDDSELSNSGSSDEEFEDVPLEGNKVTPGKNGQQGESEESEDEAWEDALGSKHHTKNIDEPEPIISGDLEFTLPDPTQQVDYSLKPDGKKGPSKIQRQIRNVTHCMHVQFLMWHNTIRNGWIQDQQVQKIMVDHLNTGCWKEIDRYWRDAGISHGHTRIVKGGWTKKIESDIKGTGVWKNSGKAGVQIFESPGGKSSGATPKSGSQPSSSKSKSKDARKSDRNQRDWGATSDRVEPNTPNLSAGDPLLRLMKYLSAFWKAKFRIVAPCLRKRGYLSPATLQAEIQVWKDGGSDPDAFGERVENIEAFRTMARKCHGSRDVGHQLFTALLRGLGIEARMVASLQPVGFGWSQTEEGKPKYLSNLRNLKGNVVNEAASDPTKGKDKLGAPSNGTKTVPIDLSDSDSDASDLSSAISVSSDSEVAKATTKRSPKARNYGDELPHPTYWTEAISNLTYTPIAVSCLPRVVVATSSMPEPLATFYCRGAAAEKAKQVFAYLVAYSSDGSAKDVTTRYLPHRQWPGKTKGFRMPIEKIPIHNKQGKVKRWEEWDWFKSVLRPYARQFGKRQPWDEVEDEGDLVPAKPAKPKDMDEEGGKETLQGYKNSTEYALERHLRREEAVNPGAKIVRHFVTGKGDKQKQEPVYFRKDVVVCKSTESWHKEGREVREGEQPLKYVPMRAVTVNRKREIEERQREEGGKVQQGLYSKAQTDWIIPDPIVDGKIPRNAFGNIDVYVPTMIPKGAIHIPLKGTARICKKLSIDYAEACTGFEFGKQRAVPILTGVVVAAENEDLVIDAWEADQEQKAAKEADKKEKLILGMWKKFFVGLRTVHRLRREYGDEAELPTPILNTPAEEDAKKSEWDTFKDHGDFEGGFLRDDQETSGGGGFVADDEAMAGGFFAPSQEEPSYIGEMTIDHGDAERLNQQSTPTTRTDHQAPRSLHSMHQNPPSEDGVEEDEDANADNQEEDGEEEDESDANEDLNTTSATLKKSLPARRPRPPKQSPHFKTRGRGTKHIPKTSASNLKTRKSITTASPPPQPERTVPKRKAATQSEKMVKSHFFADASAEDTDLTDKSVGTGRGRGRGRGRARGRAKKGL
ncbi:DNA repair protein rhp42 [Periconia macrospinosa]|uniref:DNA repair protein rhp42 n=1 Tax=Periconia macrospinosa TaxID=97972 RepID=A0A2V1DMT7_9PLEO|nr:DNA repair protein rhp42 [Periconia macrospinosa]